MNPRSESGLFAALSGDGSGAVVRVLRQAARDRVEEVRRRVTRPWREGRPGPAAEAGRWLGLGLAVGAAVAGVSAAVWAARRRKRAG